MAAVIDQYSDADAAALAVMWNESNGSWPGGFNAGPPYDAARIREWVAAHAGLARLVARVDERIVGYCDLAAEGVEAAYIPLLNVHPGYRGRGVGRDLLLRALSEVSCLNECRRVHLRTWPANDGAVQLYKKAGFFWEPGTAVDMVNYLPEVMRHPLAAEFFSRHNWYRTQRRNLTATEDGELWHGIAVFVYRFGEDGDWLTVAIDRAAGCITAVETPRLAVGGWRTRPAATPGTQMRIVTSVAAEAGAAMSIEVGCSDGLELASPPLTATDGTGSPVEYTTDVLAVRRQRVEVAEPWLARVRTDVSVGDLRAWVETALPVVEPVRLEYTGGRVLNPGVTQRLNFRLTSQAPEPITVRIDCTASDGLTLSAGDGFPKAPLALTVAAGAICGFDIQAVADPGSPVLGLRCHVSAGTTGYQFDYRLQLLAPAPGAVAVAASADGAWLANEFVLVAAEPGGVVVTDRLAGRRAARLSGLSFGPPFSGSSASDGWVARSANGACGSVIHLTQDTVDGLTVTRSLSIYGPVVSVRERVGNRGDAFLSGRRARLAIWSLLRRAQIAAPLSEGVTVADVVDGEYPLGQDYRDSPGLLSEQWVAAWDGLGAVGFVATGRPVMVFWARCLGQLTHDMPSLGPGDSVELPELRIYAGPGDWRAARSLWTGIAGDGRTAERVKPSPVSQAALAPRPAICGDADLRLAIENRRGKPLAGEVILSLPDGWRAKPTSVPVQPVVRGQPLAVPITLRRAGSGATAGASVGAAVAEIVWKAAESELLVRQPVFGIQAKGRVHISEHPDGVWRIANGRLTAKIATRFAGSLVSLQDNDRELLASSYPLASSFADIAPWHGGLHPQTSCSRSDWPGRGYDDRYHGEAVSVAGARGFAWRGVRLTVTSDDRSAGLPLPAMPALAGVERSVELLTLPGSNILAIVARVANRTPADVELSFGYDAYPLQLCGCSLSCLPSGTSLADLPRIRTANGGHATLHGLDWIAVGAEAALVVISPAGALRVDDYGDCGVLASTVEPLSIRAHTTVTRLSFVVSAASAAEALMYREFRCARELP